ncbi:MAG TPA: serine/threonine-protein kinase [Gemmataceae bacterium]|nr:serine/threonine-protein kinase [Gemmataceae bacterium]
MTQPAPTAALPEATTPVPPAGSSRGGAEWGLTRGGSIGPHPGDEVRAVLSRRLRILAPLMLAVLVFYFFRNLKGSGELASPRIGLLLQLVLLALLTASATPLYGGPRLSLRGLRGLELILFGVAATYFAWLQCGTLFEAWDLRAATPTREAAILRLALEAASARWLLLIVAYGAVIPNTRRRCAIVLITLVLMPLIIAAGAGLGHPAPRAPFALATLQMTGTLGTGGAAALFACTRLNAVPAQALEHEMVGQYQLKDLLRAGGMGEVYLAEHVLLKRPCALKLVRPGLARDPAVRRRFEREARAMAALRHPNAVAIHDSGRAADGTLYYVMEYLPGLSLDDLVARDGPLPSGRVVYLLLQLCDALGEAHSLGILHLDIKPGNILVCDKAGAGEVVKLLDFGLAREVAPHGLGLPSSGAEGAGSPQYMGPEQAAGRGPLDSRADLYGLGGVAYFLLTGRPPFECESALQLVLAHACDPVTPPSRLRPDLPADLEAVVLRCLEKEPGRRFADAAELAQALRRCACAGDWDADRAAAAWQHGGDAATVVQGT